MRENIKTTTNVWDEAQESNDAQNLNGTQKNDGSQENKDLQENDASPENDGTDNNDGFQEEGSANENETAQGASNNKIVSVLKKMTPRMPRKETMCQKWKNLLRLLLRQTQNNLEGLS